MGTDGELRDDATGRVALKDVRKVTLQESCVGNSEKEKGFDSREAIWNSEKRGTAFLSNHARSGRRYLSSTDLFCTASHATDVQA